MNLRRIWKLTLLSAGLVFVFSCTKETHIHEAPQSETSFQDVFAGDLHKADIRALVRGHLSKSLTSIAGATGTHAEIKKWTERHADLIVSSELKSTSCATANTEKLADAISCLSVATATALPNAEKYSAQISKRKAELTDRLQSLKGLLSIFFLQKFAYKKPLIAESFFRDRTFVMTAAINQMSVSSPVLSRVFNLSSLRVRFEVGGDNLRILSLPRGGSGTEQLVGKFPLTAHYRSGNDIFHEVDFTRPNESFLFPVFTSFIGDAGADFSMESFLPLLVKENGDFSNQNYDKRDASLVMEAITLMNFDASYVEATREDSANKYNVLKPTIKLSIGFIVEETEDLMKTLSLAEINDKLSFGGLADIRSGSSSDATPYFLADPYRIDVDGRSEVSALNVRRINLDKGLHFNIRGNTSEPVKQAIKDAVEIWNRNIKQVNESLKGRDVLTVRDVDEVGYMSAGDPRNSTITWDDNPSLPVAWATAASHPRTGEVLSGDVFIGGKSWAMTGCIIYFERKWQRVSEDSERTPPGDLYGMWRGVCELTLERLGIYPEKEIDLPFDLTELEDALDNGDVDNITKFSSYFTPDEGEERSTEDYYQRAINILNSEKKQSASQPLAAIEHQGCHREIAETLTLSESGNPMISSKIDSPEKAALAALTSVLAHEIGHIIGLRHNFLGSTNKGEIDFGFPTLDRTKSIMDYNDFAVDMDGGLQDSPIGAWDVLAIDTLYGDSSLQATVATPLPFCTDQNVGTIEDCYRHDFGSSRLQKAIYDMNRTLAILQKSGLGTNPAPIAQFSDDAAYLWYKLAKLGHELKRTSLSSDKDAAFQRLQMVLNGVLPSEESAIKVDSYLAEFESTFGFAPKGLMQLLDLPQSFFQQETDFLRSWDYNIVQMALVASTEFALSAAKFNINTTAGRNSDVKFHPLFTTIGYKGEQLALDEILTEKILAKVLLRPGTSVNFDKFGFGTGEKIVELDEAFLNHKDNVVLSRVDDGEETFIYRFKGRHTIQDLGVYLRIAALIAGGHRGSLSYNALATDHRLLSCKVSEAELCSDIGSVTITEDAIGSVYPLLDFYQNALNIAATPL